MSQRLMALWRRLSGSLWLVPALLAVAGMGLAIAMIEVSGALASRTLTGYPRLFGADAESSRSALAMIAGSIITVAGVTLSITMLVLSQAATQYTPRILRNFMRDRPSQVSLGVLVAVFVYCLTVIRTIRGSGEATFVPSLAVLVAYGLAVLAIAMLIYFIHHIASSLEGGSIIERVSVETLAALDRMFPCVLQAGAQESEGVQHPVRDEQIDRARPCVRSPATGYIQAVDQDRLVRLAEQHGMVLRVHRCAGEFVGEGDPLASATAGRLDDRTARSIAKCVTLASFRTVYQDPLFGIRQIVDIALKALSPGVNDPTTAITCLDYLQVILSRAATREIEEASGGPDEHRKLTMHGPNFRSLLSEALGEIRSVTESNGRVLSRLLDLLGGVGDVTRAPLRRAALREEVERTLRAVERGIRDPEELRLLRERAGRVRAALS